MKKLLIFLLSIFSLFAQQRILVDENFNDWTDVSTFYEDSIGDNNSNFGNFDFGTMWVTNDDEYLYVRIQTSDEIILVNGNFLTMFIDADNNSGTGKSISNIGAELEFTFGKRNGVSYLYGERTIYHNDIGFLSSPTFSSNDFEFAIKRDSQISGISLFQNDTIKIKMIGYTSSSFTDYYDQIPNDGGFEYVFQSGEVDPYPSYTIDKTNTGLLRMMSYNIERDNITNDDAEVQQKFRNIFETINPEIIGFSEVYSSSSQEVADRVENFLPSTESEQWYNEKIKGYDVVLVSRFKIKNSYPIETRNVSNAHNASSAFLLDLRPKYNSDMLVIVAHPKCCTIKGDEDEKRQNQFDAIMGFIRNAMNKGGVLTISPNIPIVIMGDMNLVGDVRQYNTVITGDIFYENIYGEDFQPDWDGSNLEDAKPFNINSNFTYTTNSGSFPPGRLDYFFYTGSIMNLVNSYVLNSNKLTNQQLSDYGMSADDTEVSDHLPVIVDFDLSPIVGIKNKDESPKSFGLMQNYPNPFNPTTKIEYQIKESGLVQLIVYNILGQKVATLVNGVRPEGKYEVNFSAENLPSGVYIYSLRVNDFIKNQKMALLK